MSSTTLGPVAETTNVIPLPQPSAIFGFTAPMEGGKSTISQAVSEQLNLPRVSVGEFPRRLANSPELPETRETLPDLGGRPVNENAVEFCRSVLTEQHIPSGVPLLIDGVRHQELLDALAHLLGTTPLYLIFMNIDPETQSARLREDDLPSEQTLDELQRHSNEVQVRSVLLDRASLILDGKRPVEELVDQVIRFIQDPPTKGGGLTWDQKNARRIELAKKKNRSGLSESELGEFAQLQTDYFGYLEAKHPRPRIDEARLKELESRLAEEVIRWARQAEVEGRFHQLAREWRAAVGPLSSASKIVQHPAYQEIISLGRDAVPFILQELEQKPDHWFAALRAMTGEDPVAPEDRGLMDRMASAWVRWGKEHGLRW